MKVSRQFSMRRKRRARQELVPPSDAPVGGVPRIARLMALAVRFDQLIRDGVVKNQGDRRALGRLGALEA